MRFRAPRSVSPSPVRGNGKHRASTFGLHSDSDSEEYDSGIEPSFAEEGSDDEAAFSLSSSSSSLHIDLKKLTLRPTLTPLEQREIEDNVASIRLQTRFTDPYEDWERKTRLDSFETAKKGHALTRKQDDENVARIQREAVAEREEMSATHLTKVTSNINDFTLQMVDGDNLLLAKWRQRDKDLWETIQAALKIETDKAEKRAEEERKAREEEERQQKEAELKRRLLEEKKKQEEDARKKEEEAQRQAEEEREREEALEQEKWAKIEEEKNRRLGEEVELRKLTTFTPAQEDWRLARSNLYQLKSGPVKHVKSIKEMKVEWARLRRLITPKIGQLTNDAQSIQTITRQLLEIATPSNGQKHNDAIYISLCSSLAKAILLQAETEVTAEKRSAEPLAQVAFALLERLEHFPSIFLSKMIQRCGGWLVPILVPQVDVDGLPWISPDDRAKASGVRKSINSDGPENTEEYSARVSAIMRVYFHILKITPRTQPLDRYFQMPRYWTWFARIMSDTRLLADPVAPQLLYTGLDVMGLDAMAVYGKQWAKLLNLIYKGVTVGWEEGKLIGGDSTAGAAARTRVLVSLEEIYAGAQQS